MSIQKEYEKYYASTKGGIYPTEWLIRTFKGRYPGLKFEPKKIKGNLLELGFGDGRNMPLFNEFGLKLHGMEISKGICDIAREKLSKYHIKCDLKVGVNNKTPYKDNQFNCIVACHSFYYVSIGKEFEHNIYELCRILKPGGWFICSLIDSECYLLDKAKHLYDGLYECTTDPYGVRSGNLFQAFNSKDAIEQVFSPYFTNFSIGYQKNDFYGIQSNYYILVCQKR